MTIISTDAEINSIRLKEQDTAPSTPATGYGNLYATPSGIFFINDGGVSVGPFTASGGGGAGGSMSVDVHSNAESNITLTNQANSEQFLGNSSRSVFRRDLSSYTQVRLAAKVMTTSASSNDPRLYVRYATTLGGTPGDYSAIGTSEVEVSLSTFTLAESGWINMVSGAKADVFITVLQNGGDGAADPQIGHISIEFK